MRTLYNTSLFSAEMEIFVVVILWSQNRYYNWNKKTCRVSNGLSCRDRGI